MNNNSKNILIITGYSGAGMSSALKHLEDLGYEAFDNFPLSLANSLVSETLPGQSLAIGIDTRSRGFESTALINATKELGAQLVFITAEDFILQKRFTETRRRHPLAKDRPVSAGIEKEKEILEHIKNEAKFIIDTSDLSIHGLRNVIKGHFNLENDTLLTVTLMSFGFRYGTPREADIMMDVRFLKNPHWVPELRPLSGLDKAVGKYINQDIHFEPFLSGFRSLIGPLFSQYAEGGKTYLTLAIGCTGGRHRSVYSVDKLKDWLDQKNICANIIHRDIDK